MRRVSPLKVMDSRRDGDVALVAPAHHALGRPARHVGRLLRVVPRHLQTQRRGLGKAVMFEGLRRLKKRGAKVALVGSYNQPAHALYASAGFKTYCISEPWEKEWQ